MGASGTPAHKTTSAGAKSHSEARQGLEKCQDFQESYFRLSRAQEDLPCQGAIAGDIPDLEPPRLLNQKHTVAALLLSAALRGNMHRAWNPHRSNKHGGMSLAPLLKFVAWASTSQ